MSRLRKRLVFFCLFSLASIGLCVGLGLWQLQRLEWKQQLLHSLSETTPRSYGDLPQGDTIKEFAKLKVVGVYRDDLAIKITPRVLLGQKGAHLLIPMILSNGHALLIHRGWIPDNMSVHSQSNVETLVLGIACYPKGTGWFVPKNQPDQDQWHTIDMAQIKDHYAKLAPELAVQLLPFYLLEQSEFIERRLPQPLPIKDNIRNDHLQYAITWFLLAFALLLLLVQYIRHSRS